MDWEFRHQILQGTHEGQIDGQRSERMYKGDAVESVQNTSRFCQHFLGEYNIRPANFSWL